MLLVLVYSDFLYFLSMSEALFNSFQPLSLIATTPQGVQTLQPLEKKIWSTSTLAHLDQVQVYSGSLRDHLATLWKTQQAFVFCLATGAVVRLVAPLLQDKATDPAVVVVDEAGQFVISLCGGHQGGADQLAQQIARQLNAMPILTGSANCQKLPGVDVLGVPFGWHKGEGDWTGVSAAVGRREAVEVIQEVGSTLWRNYLPENHSFYFQDGEAPLASQGRGKASPGWGAKSYPPAGRIWISATQRRFAKNSDFPKVQWHPRVLWMGMGCERGTSQRVMETAITQVCQKYHLAESAIAGIATIDLKSDEVGIVQLCQERGYPLKTFTSETLQQVQVPTPSEVVQQEVGTASVAEAAAMLAANSDQLLVSKQIVREDGEKGAVTVAIAQSDLEYTGRTGQLFLVGTGPGALTQMTPAAQSAVTQADAVIGYGLYIDLIKPILRPGQIIEALPITQERQRAQRAIELAQWGLTVAVVSSGDSGIYGMAGLVLEELAASGWDGKTPQVEIFPGISALQSASARVGTPLMHDFCAISLSDLLTPWEVIEKRLNMAAQGDFIVALYNPRSRTRTHQVQTAQHILLQHRPHDTPVALVKSAYRQDEEITLTTLEKMNPRDIDMLTTVIIGNSSTRTHANWMITPRGYLGFQQ
jgi:cobalt-precorrin 5A hydrolase/precorrin-3B C17-methyltransferase